MMTRKERNSRNKEGLLKLSPVVMETSRPFSLLSAWQWTVESETDLSNCLQGGSIIIQWAHASLSCFPSLSLTPFVCLSLCLWSFWHFFCLIHYFSLSLPLWLSPLSLFCSSIYIFMSLSVPPSSWNWMSLSYTVNHPVMGAVCRWVNLLKTFNTDNVLAACVIELHCCLCIRWDVTFRGFCSEAC